MFLFEVGYFLSIYIGKDVWRTFNHHNVWILPSYAFQPCFKHYEMLRNAYALFRFGGGVEDFLHHPQRVFNFITAKQRNKVSRMLPILYPPHPS